MIKIGANAFQQCIGLRAVTLSDHVTTIETYAFGQCSGLKSITVGNGLKTIRSGAFAACNSFSSLYLKDLAVWCNVNFADTNANPLYFASHLYLNDVEIKDVVIPDGVTNISQAV